MATLFLPVACIVKQQKKTNSAAESKTRRQSGELQSRPKTPRAAESVSSRRGFRKVAFGTRVEYILQSVSVWGSQTDEMVVDGETDTMVVIVKTVEDRNNDSRNN